MIADVFEGGPAGQAQRRGHADAGRRDFKIRARKGDLECAFFFVHFALGAGELLDLGGVELMVGGESQRGEEQERNDRGEEFHDCS